MGPSSEAELFMSESKKYFLAYPALPQLNHKLQLLTLPPGRELLRFIILPTFGASCAFAAIAQPALLAAWHIIPKPSIKAQRLPLLPPAKAKSSVYGPQPAQLCPQVPCHPTLSGTKTTSPPKPRHTCIMAQNTPAYCAKYLPIKNIENSNVLQYLSIICQQLFSHISHTFSYLSLNEQCEIFTQAFSRKRVPLFRLGLILCNPYSQFGGSCAFAATQPVLLATGHITSQATHKPATFSISCAATAAN